MAQNNFAVQSDKDGNIQWPKSSTNFKGGINVNGLDVAQQIKSNTFNPIKAFAPNQPVNESYIDTKYEGSFSGVGNTGGNTTSTILSGDKNQTITFNDVRVSGSENDNPDTTLSYGIKLDNNIEMYLGQWVRVKIKCENLIMPNFYDPNTNLKYSECFDDFGNIKKEPGTIVFYLRLNDLDNTNNAYPETGKYGPMVLHRYSQNAVSDFKYVIYNVDPDNLQNNTNTQKFNSYGITGSYGQIYQMPYIAKIENSQVFNKTKIGTQYIDMYIRLDPTIFENYSYGSDISSIEKLPVQLFMTVPTGYNISGSITIESVETIKSTADFIDLYQISFGKYASGNTNWANQLQGGEVYAYNRRFVRYEQEYVGDIGEKEKNDYTYFCSSSVVLPPKLRLDCGVKIPQTGSLTIDAIWMYDHYQKQYRKVKLYNGMFMIDDSCTDYVKSDSNSFGTYRDNYYGKSEVGYNNDLNSVIDYNIPNFAVKLKDGKTVPVNWSVDTVKDQLEIYGNYVNTGLLGNSITSAEKTGSRYNIEFETKDPDWWRKIGYNYQQPILPRIKGKFNNGKESKEYTDLQQAIDEVYSAGGGEVWLTKGIYKHGSPLTMKNNVAIYGGFDGTETSKDERVAGNNTILDGEGKYEVFYNNYTESNLLTNSAKLDNVTIQNGYANYGAGMYNEYASPEITNCTFSGNSASVYGGGMRNINSSSPTLTNCTFTNNSASSSGGGMCNGYSSSPVLTNCTFSGNRAEISGGVMENTHSSNPVLTNCTFSNNSASYRGGGMYNIFSSSPVLTNCILWENTASSSGNEIYNSGSDNNPTIDTCIIKGGKSGIYNNSYGTYTNIITADPKLMPLGNYGGFVQTIAVEAGSSAIKAGKVVDGLTTDARGYTRPTNSKPTIGAYEYIV